MSFPSIPTTLQEWNIEILDKLTGYRDIESDVFDFKGEINKLDEHLCAMANSGGGTLVLGIEEIKNSQDYLVGFRKKGFDDGQQNSIHNTIGNYVFQVEPNPKVEIKHIPDANGKFYTVVRVLTEESKKPYSLKDRGQFYVRINSSSRPASRAVIFNLFTNTAQKRSEVDRLRVSVEQFKESILSTTREISEKDYGSTSRIIPVDLVFIQSAMISTEWFLRENRLLGKTVKNGYEFGLYQIIHIITSLNLEIEGFNSEVGVTTEKRLFWERMRSNWMTSGSDTERVIEFLDKVINTANDYLSKHP